MRTILAALILLVMVSCTETTHPKHTLRIQISEDPETLDPRQARSLNALAVCKMLYDGLTRIDASGKPILSLAKAVEVSSDGLTYTFKLRYAKWTNGDAITADDFVKNWRSDAPSPNAFMLSSVQSVNASDSQTLVVQLKQPLPYFLEFVAHPVFYPKAPQEGVTNGPFQLKNLSPNEELYLTKNPSYWDAESVKLNGICLCVIPDDLTALHLFHAGDLDWMGSPLGAVPIDHIETLKEEKCLFTYPMAATLWYKLNTSKPPLNHPKIRKALAYVINRQAIIDHIVPFGQLPATSPVPPVTGSLSVSYFQDGDVQTAKQLFNEALDEMGMTRDELPTIRLLVSTNERYRKIAQAIQEQWAKHLGLNVRLLSQEFKMVLAQMRSGDYDIGGKIWFGDFNDPISFLEIFADRNDRLNETGWQHDEFATLITLAKSETDLAKRSEYLKQAEQIFVDEMPVIPIHYHAMCYVKNDQITNVALPPVGASDFKWAEMR